MSPESRWCDIVKHLAAQLSADAACLRRYLNRPSSHREHAGEIQCHLGYRDFSDQPGHFRLLRWRLKGPASG
jgi:hypothetical protein